MRSIAACACWTATSRRWDCRVALRDAPKIPSVAAMPDGGQHRRDQDLDQREGALGAEAACGRRHQLSLAWFRSVTPPRSAIGLLAPRTLTSTLSATKYGFT